MIFISHKANSSCSVALRRGHSILIPKIQPVSIDGVHSESKAWLRMKGGRISSYIRGVPGLPYLQTSFIVQSLPTVSDGCRTGTSCCGGRAGRCVKFASRHWIIYAASHLMPVAGWISANAVEVCLSRSSIGVPNVRRCLPNPGLLFLCPSSLPGCSTSIYSLPNRNVVLSRVERRSDRIVALWWLEISTKPVHRVYALLSCTGGRHHRPHLINRRISLVSLLLLLESCQQTPILFLVLL